MAPVRPFKITIPDSEIEKLRKKLSLATFPEEVEFSDDWHYGAPLKDIRRLAQYWQDGFDWRSAEAKLNELPQFSTAISVDGHGDIDVHFVHQKSTRADSIPLLFCHGWPGSFLEVIKLLPLLTSGDDASKPSFHVVAPSLPNFGFSGRAPRRGFAIPQYAEVCHKLMKALGYEHYVTQGGDWGYIITRMMTVLYPEHVLAAHVNYVRKTEPPTFTETPATYLKHAVLPYSAEEKAGLERTSWFHNQGFGYNLEQSTRPNTIGFALADSPVALLAWIYEKLHDWTDSYAWTDDEVLTWIGIYAFSTAGPEASVRIYYESTHSQLELHSKARAYVPGVPLGLSYFPRDLVVPPSTWGRSLGPVVFERRHQDGGHFAAYERPEKLAGDLMDMFGKGGGAEKVAKRITAA
ncbi:putative epoxide hydrolase protein [Phaeoacremonium minimum UCRPA7]|uniref:Putative epoxide hydrolase protein n=1 Tax=Phaeoacremonium minimum (strain UCR-PA7) TaxID=1286976 RepID=R8BHN5_PHAM7|nr:putative epoxide hydrolase protein [Phaeoacremonium minimum UCRPA7]EON98828.1 putative epoxide hydrolase protein [Phaeoacremonium minimum UCRPA7]